MTVLFYWKEYWLGALALCAMPSPALAGVGQDCLQLYYMKSYQQAFPLCQQAAEAGYDQAQYVLGVMYVEGRDGEKNNAQAARWFKAAAAQGYAAARFKFNNIDREYSDRERQQFTSKLWAQQMPLDIDGSDEVNKAKEDMRIETFPEAMSMPSAQYVKPVLQKHIRPRLVVKKSAMIASPLALSAQGKPMAYPQYEGLNSAETADLSKEMALDMAEANAGTTQPTLSLFQDYAQAAKQGDADAQLMLGLMYHEGSGVKKNDVRAVYLLQQAANQGNAQAQLSLALMLHEGQGVKKNEAEAKNWFTRAAQKGLADAQYSLGVMYASNRRFKSDAKAVRWWKKAAAQKHMLAEHNLAVMYLKGIGVKGERGGKDRQEAVRWFEAEAKHGNPIAQFNLGQLYSEGKWLDKNAELAVNWFYRAGANHLALDQKDDAMKAANKIKHLSSQQSVTVSNGFLADVLTRQIQESKQ